MEAPLIQHRYDIERSAFRSDHFNVLCACGYRSDAAVRLTLSA